MTPQFTITIDFSRGSYSVWSQKKEKIPPEQERKLNAIKKKIEQMLRTDLVKQPELIP